MASALKNLSSYNELNIPNAKGLRFGIVLSEWNKEITHVLYNGAFETLLKHNVNENDILLYQVPGTYELPVAAEWISDQKVDAVICLGCVIKGDTDHDKYINQSVAMALQYLSIQKKIPFIFGVLTTNNYVQAEERAGGIHGNKGVEAAITAIRMANLKNNR
jgi:6,7-dimethyl-8-ribityllumazine synthase